MRVSAISVVAVSMLVGSAAVAAPPGAAADRSKPKMAYPPPVVMNVVPPVTKAPAPVPNLDAMFAFVDKLFPPQPDPDPARLALARTSVQAMWPDGAYGNMMTGFLGGMMNRVMQLKKSDLPAVPGKGAKDNKEGKTTASSPQADLSLHDQIAAKDPYFDQRMAAMQQVVRDEMGKISAIIDPRMREGLARAMARKFDAQQLTDINRFFAGPSGHAFAGQYMQLWMDPDTIRSIFTAMPEMMKLMPDMMQKFKAANDKFPSPKKTPAAAAPKS